MYSDHVISWENKTKNRWVDELGGQEDLKKRGSS